MKCLFCGTDNPDAASICSQCGREMVQREAKATRDFEQFVIEHAESDDSSIDTSPYSVLDEERSPPNMYLVFGGVLLIVAGAIGIAIIALIGGIFSIAGISGASGLMLFALGDFFALIGGILALMKRNFTTIVIFSVFGIAGGIISPYLISSLLAFIALALISSSHYEFE